jgi:hypothetical protein
MTDSTITVTVTDSDGAATSGSVVVTNSTGDPWATLDGRLNAPAGSPQLPNLLNGYPINAPANARQRWPNVNPGQPPWLVAGVDYAVGVPAGLILKDPNTILNTIPGASGNNSSRIVTITGNNVVIDGYDFSLNGGWQVQFLTCNNPVVRNCKFVIGSNGLPPIKGGDGNGNYTTNNPYVGYCTIDGNKVQIGGGYASSMITFGNGAATGSGGTVEYCWIKNSANDVIDHGGQGPLIVQYNLLSGAGMMPGGAHGDYIQICGGTPSNPFTLLCKFNTLVHSNGSTQGFMAEPDFSSQGDGYVGNCEWGWNTFVIGSSGSFGGMGYMTGVTLFDLDRQGGHANNHDNYIDARGALNYATSGRGAPNDGDPRTVFAANTDMTTGTVSSNFNDTPPGAP